MYMYNTCACTAQLNEYIHMYALNFIYENSTIIIIFQPSSLHFECRNVNTIYKILKYITREMQSIVEASLRM